MADEKPAKRKRGYIPDASLYHQKTQALMNLLTTLPLLTPHDPHKWDLEGEWHKAGDVVFIDKQYMLAFEPYARFDCRTVKLINLGLPAARLTFYQKHKYKIRKDDDIDPLLREKSIRQYVNMLTVRIATLESQLERVATTEVATLNQRLAHLKQQRKEWQHIHTHQDQYELVISNFEQNHIYTQVNIKTFSQRAGTYENVQQHLLNHQFEPDGSLSELRYNVIFINLEEIQAETHTYQNKTIHLFLAGFPHQATELKDRLYARPRLVSADVAGTEASASPTPFVSTGDTEKPPRPLPAPGSTEKRPKKTLTPPPLDLFSEAK